MKSTHRDKHNESWVTIIGLGDYQEGGKLHLRDIGSFNIKHTFFTFDGKNIKHWAEPWEKGDRIIVACYKLKPLPDVPVFKKMSLAGDDK